MSIINEALKKADYLKKLKNITSSFGERASNASHQTVLLEEPPPNVSEQTLPNALIGNRNLRSKSSLGIPEESKRQEVLTAPIPKFKFDPPIQLSKIVTIVFVVSGCLLLVLGPWFYMWKGRESAVVEKQIMISPAGTEKLIPVEQLEEIPKAKEEPPKPQFTSYRNSNVRPSVKPVPVTLKKPESVYHLTGISILNDRDKLAFVNGKVLQIGSKINDAEVILIEQNKVVLKKANKELTLLLNT